VTQIMLGPGDTSSTPAGPVCDRYRKCNITRCGTAFQQGLDALCRSCRSLRIFRKAIDMDIRVLMPVHHAASSLVLKFEQELYTVPTQRFYFSHG
jgi:hypothetical protein